MKLLKYDTINVDGIDKSGKDTLVQYLTLLSDFKYMVHSRGIISQIAYNKLYDRHFTYDSKKQKNVINVYLTVDKDDWNIRCKLTNEPYIDYDKNTEYFNTTKTLLNDDFIIYEYNTSTMTPYQIALDVLNKVDKLNKLDIEEEDSNG